MKKLIIFLVLFLLVSFAAIARPAGWGAIKLGYGTETSGLGLAIEMRTDDGAGGWLGVGYFSGYVGGSVGVRAYVVDISDLVSLSLSGSFGLLGVRYNWSYSTSSGSSYSHAPVWGPTITVGLHNANPVSRFLGDVSIGIGYNPDTGVIFAGQSSVGYLTRVE